VLVEFHFESGILLRCEEFIELTKDIAMHIAAQAPTNLEELLNQVFVKQTEITVQEHLTNVISQLRESIIISRFVRWDINAKEPIANPEPPKSPAVAMRVVR
jgi:translation elongation factor EF-Ts